MTRGARVSLNQIESLDWHIELRLVGIVEEHELAGSCAEVECLQATESCYPMIDMNDEITRSQIAKVGKESSGFGASPESLSLAAPGFGCCATTLDRFNCFVEYVSFHVNDQPRIWQFKASGKPADGDNHCRVPIAAVFCYQR